MNLSPVPMGCAGVLIQLADQGIRVIMFRDSRNHVRIEVAVGAFTDAVRDMNIQRKGLHVDGHVPNIRTNTSAYNSIAGEQLRQIS